MEIGRLLLLCGVISGPLFILVFLIEGFLRPGYNPLRQPVSALSLGPRGWIQQANFFVCGVLLLACAVGLYMALTPFGSFWGWLLIFLYALGLMGAGVFVTRDNTAVPRHSRGVPAGLLHDLFSTIVFVSLCSDCFVLAHTFSHLGSPAWALSSIIAGVLYGAGFIIFARAFSPTSLLAPVAGLLQRLTISLGALWLALVCIYFL